MRQHNYGWDLNNLTYKANELNNYQIESYAMNLDNLLSQQGELTPEMTELVDMTINLLHGLLQDEQENQDDY